MIKISQILLAACCFDVDFSTDTDSGIGQQWCMVCNVGNLELKADELGGV